MKREKFDFRYINKDNVYIGDIMLVTSVNQYTLNEIKKCDTIIGDFSGACNVELAKENAILIKVSNNLFVDLDSIEHLRDLDYINNCLKNNITDNVILRQGTFNPFVGQLFLRKVRTYDIKKEVTDILELKLIKR